MEETNYLIDANSITTDGTLYLGFSLNRLGEAWAKGDYKIVLYVDGKQELSVPFCVR